VPPRHAHDTTFRAQQVDGNAGEELVRNSSLRRLGDGDLQAEVLEAADKAVGEPLRRARRWSRCLASMRRPPPRNSSGSWRIVERDADHAVATARVATVGRSVKKSFVIGWLFQSAQSGLFQQAVLKFHTAMEVVDRLAALG
jgi:hypothetical protein